MGNNLFPVGTFEERFNEVTGQSLPCLPILQSSGLIKHVQRRHPEDVHYVNDVPSIIADPDYIGQHPSEPNSLEIVKIMDDNVMVCVKLDSSGDYYFVASVFCISGSKLKNRIHSGRLKKY